ncbi:MAG: malate dehydrogenase [Chromatiales bacterium 21-64-14]|nr:MAG: malate dehydrogenase [Chromatiales bacterium 21-64-14]HQU16827.1 malate dehydrogenase [Gammaproteobacteria bacterium]
MDKITVVGAGRVGESTAQILAQQEMCRELVLLDIREGIAEGVALDIQETAPLFGFDTRVSGSSGAEAITGSQLVVITAGLPRKPGMSRSDLLDTNAAIVRGTVDHVLRLAPQAMILVVSNPVDVMTYEAWRHSGWDRRRVFGLSGVLDAARMAHFIARETGISVMDVTAMVLGGHGDSMVPMPRYSTIHGIPIAHFLHPDAIERIMERTRHGGAEILALKKTSSANDSPAAAIAAMVDAVVYDRKRVLPCVALLDGEYGLRDVAMGVPCVVGRGGIGQVIGLPLTEHEQQSFTRSAESVRGDIQRLKSAASGAN